MRTSETIKGGDGSYARAGLARGGRPPGPTPAPLLGWLLHRKRFWLDPIGYLDATYREHGLISALGSAPPQQVFAFAPEHNQLLMDEPERFHWLGPRARSAAPPPPDAPLLAATRANIFTIWGEQYRTRGALIRPAFNHSWVDGWRDAMVELTERTLATWRVGAVVDVHEDLNRLVHAIAMKTVLGLEDERLVELLYTLEKGAPRENFGTTLLPYDLPGMPFRRLLRTTEKIVSIVHDVVAEKVKQGGEPRDMVGAWMQARTKDGAAMSELELVAEAYNLMHHSTTMSTLIWTLILVLQHPRVHADLLDELHGVLHGAAPAASDLERLPLLDRVIKESMRLLPPPAFGRRFNTEPCAFGPYQLPASVPIIFSSYITQRLPSIYAEPRRFRPERWETIKPSLYEYFPFGARVRHCVGSIFATMELKVVLATLLQRCGLSLVPRQRIDRRPRILTLLRPAGAVLARVTPPARELQAVPLGGQIHEMVDLA